LGIKGTAWVAFLSRLGENGRMQQGSLPPELLAAMEEAARSAMSNVRNRADMEKACERMDKMREEIKKKHGILDIGVPAIRELRGERSIF
jgi:succinate dehydrogenase/fumarate reductase flavoprotein subunit